MDALHNRIKKEYLDLQKEKNSNVLVKLVNNDYRHWKGRIKGPIDTCYQGGIFDVDIIIPDDYPFKPPKMKFDTKIWHPNISSVTGAICLDILKNEWTPALTIRTALISLQALMCEPVPNDPQDAVVAKQYMSDIKLFNQTAKHWVEEYANPERNLQKKIKEITERLNINYVFKASFDKANRSSYKSYRGPGLEKGLEILAEIKKQLQVPIVTDIHETIQAEPVSKVVDVIQIPAFLCRQTDLLDSAAKTGKAVNVKKAQFLSPNDMKNVIEKLEHFGTNKIMLTERGNSFGYNNFVVDMRSLPIMRSFGYPVIFDGTHSVQLPGGAGTTSSGQREFVKYLVRAAVAIGIDGLFLEVHDNPEEALSDGANMVYLDKLEELLNEVISIHNVVKNMM